MPVILTRKREDLKRFAQVMAKKLAGKLIFLLKLVNIYFGKYVLNLVCDRIISMGTNNYRFFIATANIPAPTGINIKLKIFDNL